MSRLNPCSSWLVLFLGKLTRPLLEPTVHSERTVQLFYVLDEPTQPMLKSTHPCSTATPGLIIWKVFEEGFDLVWISNSSYFGSKLSWNDCHSFLKCLDPFGMALILSPILSPHLSSFLFLPLMAAPINEGHCSGCWWLQERQQQEKRKRRVCED